MIGQLRVIKVLGNGRRRFDAADKERLIAACLEPGVSLSRLALDHGVNANQLRNWVILRQRKAAKVPGPRPAREHEVAFVPVVEAAPVKASSACRGPLGRCVAPHGTVVQGSSRARLKASLPNGVRLELEGCDAVLLSALIAALGHCDVPAGG